MLQFEEGDSFEQDAVQQAVEGYYQGEADGALLCPVCKQHNIRFQHQCIMCPCGVRVNTQTDHVDDSFLRQQLMTLVSHHSDHCCQQPFFCVQDTFGVEGLYMMCNSCDTLELVI